MNEVLQLGPDALVATILKLEEMIKGDCARGTKGAMTRNKSIKNVFKTGKSVYQHCSGLNKMFNKWVVD